LNIRFGSSQAATVSIQLFNSLGQRVHTLETTLLSGATLRQLPIGHLPAGIYQLSVSCEEASGSRMVVVE
ncbi:MAG: T9SS type A sorting domain-containing protein, partial [Candidatus Omnitrophica bacterium]|nr:T9SS type A sorting domain-containing protein [Candidatus Omnitrophota bacterium]